MQFLIAKIERFFLEDAFFNFRTIKNTYGRTYNSEKNSCYIHLNRLGDGKVQNT